MSQATQLTMQPDDTGALRLNGEVDLRSVDQLVTTVGRMLDRGGRTVVDLSDMTFCDSTGVGAFVRLHNRAEAAGAVLVLRSPPERFVRILAVTGLHRLLNLTPA